MSRGKNVNVIFKTNESSFNLPNKIKDDLLYMHIQKLSLYFFDNAQIFQKM